MGWQQAVGFRKDQGPVPKDQGSLPKSPTYRTITLGAGVE